MFSGKSTEGSKHVSKEQLSKVRQPIIFTPLEAKRKLTLAESGIEVDTTQKMCSRAGSSFSAIEFTKDNPSVIVNHVQELLAAGKTITTVIIEEAHFCSMDLVQVAKQLAEVFNMRVIVIGLDQTFDDIGFGPVPALMVEAEFVTKELAVCVNCGSFLASKSWLDTRAREDLTGKVLVGDKSYQALCRHCKREFRQNFEA
jgi:thymidine kinase